MLNYTENAHISTNVPLLSVPSTEHHECITEPLPEMTQQQVPPLPVANPQPELLLGAGTLTFRRATIETESMDDLDDGIICGQVSGVDLLCEEVPLTSKHLAPLFTETMQSGEPEAFNVGFIVGLVDALLRARKTYPHGW